MSPSEIRTRGRHLNHVAWLYDPLIERLFARSERRFRIQTLEYMDIRPGQHILDVGCGTGSLTLLVAGRLAGTGSVTGIDAAPRMIEIARKKAERAGSKAVFSVGIAEELDFEGEVFDIVVNSMFTHHIDTGLKRLAFAEMYRVLKPGGLLVTADIDKPTTAWAKISGWASRYLLFQPELEDNLRGDLPRLMTEAGFTPPEKRAHLYGLVSFFTARKPKG